MKYNYHTHTIWCGHATGTPEEYVIRAMGNGVKTLGFSEHIPLVFPDGFDSGYRLRLEEAKEYFTELTLLKEKYSGKIDIKIGFEMEYYPAYYEEMLDNARRLGAEYLILGQHFINNEHPGGTYVGIPTENKEHLKEYTNTVIDAVKKGVFTYIAHPDIFNFIGEKSFYKEQMRKICIASREYNIPLEINFLGIRDKRSYPNDTFFEIAGTEKSPVTFGFDAHDAESAYDGNSLTKANMMVDKYKLNYIGEPNLVSIK